MLGTFHRVVLSLSCISIMAGAAHAGTQAVVASHQSCTDPLTEGWVALGNPIGVTGSANCELGAWNLDDASTVGSTIYRKSFPQARIDLATNVGWTLRGVVGANTNAGTNTPFRTTHAMSFRTASRGYDVFVRAESEDSSITVLLTTAYDVGMGASAVTYNFPVTQVGEMHEYALEFNPATASANLRVDGVEVLSAYGGASLAPVVCCHRAVSWGAVSTAATGNANWASVEFLIHCNVPVSDITGEGTTDLTDLATLLTAFGSCDGSAGYNPAADFNRSGCVDLADLAVLLSEFGTGCN